ncbi:uncharacterized protein C8R40DRAFT_1173847 [Lentinula edodes]|uniref:uncharacterized protein n=1 Tax=Lentinula edodes TaxID=5353 RepID=UPI001E8DCAF4|nr:uncharacterized protein C8R40DRAFT_1173847 [Lentinula edodes]KAH7872109.1 hypothetical protein C8R40DRAFT_1173847 [Lentinula edodes]KAJ3917951.1 hypothetical protein F5877DRAFT_43597 [Lentinula edodes]
MSISPPISMRRLSSAISASKEQEELINAYEAEEERITNVLSRKLEQLRVEKIQLENVLEAESENHVNRLSRELATLRAAQQQQANGDSVGSVNGHAHHALSGNDPTTEVMLEALRRENEQLRNRLADIERDYIRMSRLNEIYREELIDHRNRIGQPVDNLIGMSSLESHSQHTHHRSSSSMSSMSSSSVSPHSTMYSSTHTASRPHNGVPIPRPPSQIRRPNNNISEGNTPLSHSPTSASSSESPYAISSPVLMSGGPTSLMSNLTTPPSSASLHNLMQYNGVYGTLGVGPRALSYPSVPPPSLSSSFGSPTVSYHMGHREPSLSPVEPLSRRNSSAGLTGARRGDYRVAESGNLRSISASRSHSRRESLERGARVAETGSLARSRAGSHSQGPSLTLPSTTEDVDDVNFVDEGPVFS